MESEKNLSELNFIQREYSIEHPTYDTELLFYDAVSSGNIDYLNTHYNSQDVNDITRGILSDNPLQNLKYHVVITIAMITRFCIEKGMNEK